MNPILYFAGVGLLWVCLSAIALGVCRLVAVCQDRKQVNPVEVFRALAVAGGTASTTPTWTASLRTATSRPMDSMPVGPGTDAVVWRLWTDHEGQEL